MFEQPAASDAALRRDMGRRGAGGPEVSAPYDDLARQIGEAAYRVTDAQMAAVRQASRSDREAFELVAAAAVGAGLKRWHVAIELIDEAAA